MNQEATKGKNRENDARDGYVKRVVERFALHFYSIFNLAEVKPATVSMVCFGESGRDLFYAPVSAFHKTICKERLKQIRTQALFMCFWGDRRLGLGWGTWGLMGRGEKTLRCNFQTCSIEGGINQSVIWGFFLVFPVWFTLPFPISLRWIKLWILEMCLRITLKRELDPSFNDR